MQVVVLVEFVAEFLRQQELDGRKRKAGNLLIAFQLGFEPKRHCHQRQRYVVIPGRPTPGLALMQAQLLPVFLKRALDLVTLHLAP